MINTLFSLGIANQGSTNFGDLFLNLSKRRLPYFAPAIKSFPNSFALVFANIILELSNNLDISVNNFLRALGKLASSRDSIVLV